MCHLVRMYSRAMSFLPSPPGLLRGTNFSCFTIRLTCHYTVIMVSWCHHVMIVSAS